MRSLSSPDVVSTAMNTLKGKARVKRAMWSRRAQEYEQKINSGDLISIAEVVRDLHRADDQREQSYSERQLYEAALERLTREVAAVSGSDETAAQKQVDDVLVAPRRLIGVHDLNTSLRRAGTRRRFSCHPSTAPARQRAISANCCAAPRMSPVCPPICARATAHDQRGQRQRQRPPGSRRRRRTDRPDPPRWRSASARPAAGGRPDRRRQPLRPRRSAGPPSATIIAARDSAAAATRAQSP